MTGSISTTCWNAATAYPAVSSPCSRLPGGDGDASPHLEPICPTTRRITLSLDPDQGLGRGRGEVSAADAVVEPDEVRKRLRPAAADVEHLAAGPLDQFPPDLAGLVPLRAEALQQKAL